MYAWKLFKGNWHHVASVLFTSSLSVAVSSAYCIWEIRDKFLLIHFSCINMKPKVVSLVHLHFWVTVQSSIDLCKRCQLSRFHWCVYISVFTHMYTVQKGTQLLHFLFNCFEQCTFGFLNFNVNFYHISIISSHCDLDGLMQGHVSD